jgi:hypothetical protein
MESDEIRFVSKALRIYFFANALIAAVCLLVLLLLPTDPKNAWVFGLSRSRIALVLVFIFLVLFFVYLGVKSFRNPRFNQVINEKVINFVSEYRLILLVMLPVYGFTFIVLFGYFYVQIRYQAITSLQVFLDRLLPLILFGFSFIILTSLLIFLVNSRIPITQPESKILFINPKKVFIVLILVMVLLILVSIFLNLFILLDIQVFRVARRIFDLNTERNIPTLYSSVTLLISSMLLGYIAYLTRLTGGRFSLLWAILSFGFLFLSVDETAYIHENLSEDVAGWIFVVAPFVILFFLLYIRFFFHLPRSTKLYFLLAALLFIGGAFFLEFVGSWRISMAGEDRIATTLLFTSVEESFEMFGINLFIYALLLYLRDNFPEYYLSFQKPIE